MSTPEQGHPVPAVAQAGERRSWRRRLLGRWLPAVVMVAVVGGLAVALLGGGGGSSPNIGSVGSADTSGWQTYHDPMEMFSLRLPPGWTAQVSDSSGTMGDRTGNMTQTTESVSLSDPAQGEASAQLIVTAEPINSDFAHHWYCQAWPTKNDNSTFHGIPAEAQPAVWLFNSANAHFQLDVTVPGVVAPPHELGPISVLPPTPTPLPASVLATDQSDINGVLATFRPANASPLSC